MSHVTLKESHDAASLVYPFSALHGQSDLQLALLLVAVDPRIGGVLIEGARGTAKTTSARALADILPAGAFVNLPLGTSEEHLAGSLDLDVVLQQGKSSFRPGLLARAHQGVLYVDEINLLADVLVDLLLDVCSSGMNRIERDGVSHQHAAEIVLVGTMNPEEGDLRPQLLDRFGLFVSVDDSISMDMRQRIVRSRMAFDDDPHAFHQRYAEQQQRRVAQLVSARQIVRKIAFTESDYEQVSRKCHAARVDGVRADLVMLRASRAMAALDGRYHIAAEDIDAVADMVLAHRRRSADDASAEGATGDSSEATRLKSDADSRQDDSRNPSGLEPNAENLDEQNSSAAAQATDHDLTDQEFGQRAPQEPSPPNLGRRSELTGEAVAEASAQRAAASEDAHWGAMPGQSVPIREVRWPAAFSGEPNAKKS